MKSRFPLAVLFAVSLIFSLAAPVFADGIIIPNPPICVDRPCPPPPCRPLPPCADCPVRPIRCPPFDTPLRVKSHRVNVVIDNQVTTTHVDQTFVNDASWAVEGTYIFPLPAEATVSDFAMWVNGQRVEAKILNADEARRIYDDIVRQRRDPALLEYVGRGAVQASIFPIPPAGERRIEVEYSQVLRADGGLIRYVYPLNTEKFSAQPLESVSVSVELKSPDAIKAIYSPSHEVSIARDGDLRARVSYEASNVLPDHDFELIYTVSPQDIGLNLLTYRGPADDQGFFLLLAAPNVQVETGRAVAKDVILVLDTSASMEGEKIAQAQAALRYVLAHLNPDDRFNIISFSDSLKRYADSLQPARDAGGAQPFIDRLSALGSTDINRALLEALGQVDAERPATIIFLTDGLPTAGEVNPDRIEANFASATRKNVRLFAFGVGDDVNAVLLDTLAQANRGASAYVRPGRRIDEEVSAFYAKVATPVLADIGLDFGPGISVSDVYPQTLPDLFAGSQLVLVGRYTGSGPAAITLKGQVSGRDQVFTYEGSYLDSGGAAFIARLWATRKIGYLLNQIRLHGENKELIDQIVALSVRYGIITPYTSFLIQEQNIFTEQDRSQIAADQYRLLAATQAPAAGAAAVDEAQKQEALRSADVAAPVGGEARQVVRIVGDKAFLLKDEVWIDTAFDPSKMKPAQVGFGSDEYFKLLDARPEWGGYFALGSRVIVAAEGKAYEIVEGASGGPLEVPPTRMPQPTVQPARNTPTASASGAPTKAPAASTGNCLGAALAMVAMTLTIAGVGRARGGWRRGGGR